MEAGVINYKLCPYNYACNLCSFDKAMKESGQQEPRPQGRMLWTNRLRELSGPEKYCRHMLQGLVSYKLCPNNYDCATCQYDQMIQDTIGDVRVPELRQIRGFRIPLAYHYHRKHSWITVEYGGKCRVGFDDFADQVLGQDHEFVLPAVGKPVAQNEPFMKVKAADREFTLDAPVDGTITAVNPLQKRGEELDPYTDGWVAFIEPSRRMPANLAKLLYGDKAMEWLSESADKLVEVLTPGKVLAADGGIIRAEVYGGLTPDVRGKLIDTVMLGD
jgi:glycine cleavage system H lipoate-binding protein